MVYIAEEEYKLVIGLFLKTYYSEVEVITSRKIGLVI